MRARLLSLPLALVLATVPLAQVTSVGPFMGEAQEGFEGKTVSAATRCINERIFSSQADLCALYSSGIPGVYSSWGASCITSPKAGTAFVSSPSSGHLITFDRPVYTFGGYFSTSSTTPHGLAIIRDPAGAVISVANITAPNNCNWFWNGWQAAPGAPFGSIELCSNHPFGEFLGLDSLEVIFEPSVQLSGVPSQISVSGGGIQILTLDLDDTHAGKIYQILGSVSGTLPGIPVGGALLPLNPDAYLLYTLSNPNTVILGSSLGMLDSLGSATARFSLGGVSDPALVGANVHHAGFAIDFVGGGFALAEVSNAAVVTLAP